VENEISHKIKVLRFDNGGEFVSKKFDAFLAKCGIQRQIVISFAMYFANIERFV
jgi:hypothetical protein